MAASRNPSVTVLIPTLNAASVLEKCLSSIARQNYPKKKLEIIIADGGSTDQTLKVIKKFAIRNSQFAIKTIKNPLKTGEAGKAAALRHAHGELVALIDSDNLLPTKNWFRKMVAPFADPEIIGSEPWQYTYRRQDGFIDRYCALMGMNDPLCYFLGNYDRANTLTGQWTGLPVKTEDQGNWLKITLRPQAMPTIGANGTILRREVLAQSDLVDDYLFDIDVLAQLAQKKPLKFAKAKVGLVHLYCGRDIGKFIRKQKRRVSDYFYYQKLGVRHYPWSQQNKLGLFRFIFSCFTILPLAYQSLAGYLKKPDLAWFFHPLACWLTLWVYGWGRIKGIFEIKEMSRQGWRQ